MWFLTSCTFDKRSFFCPEFVACYYDKVQSKRSILLGYFTTHSTTSDDLNSKSLIFSPVTQSVENITQGEISKKIRLQWRNLSKPEQQISIFSFIHEKKILRSLFPECEEMALVELGHFDASEENDINLKLENIRKNIRRSCSALCQNFSVSYIDVDICDYPKVAAESAVYGIFNRNEIVCKFPKYSYFYDQDSKLLPVSIRPLVGQNISDISEDSMKAFGEGLVIGECQNFARYLHGAVSYISRSEFFQYVKEKFSSFESVKLNIRDEDWIQSMQMKSIQQVFSINRRSTEQGKFYNCFFNFPCLLEIHYESCSKSQPIVLVGRSSFYNSSNSYFVTENRQPVYLIQNLSGGASIIGCILALVRLKVPVNVIGIIVLCDHSFCWRNSSSMNIASHYDIFSEVPNSHEERLILKDAVSYACSFDPKLIITVATQTNYLTEAFLDYTSVLYSTDDSLAELFLEVSCETGERFIRLPFVDIEDDVFEKCVIMKQFCSDCRQVLNEPLSPDIRQELTDYISKNWDFCFITSCCLKDLLKEQKWIHLELNKGLLIDKNSEDEVFETYEVTGAPTRSFVYFIQNLANIKDVSA